VIAVAAVYGRRTLLLLQAPKKFERRSQTAATITVMIFRNGRLIFSDGIREGLELVVREGKISDVRDRGAVADEVVDLRGNYLAPGFIDLHLHGAMGRDTMEATAEAFQSICEYHASGGTTSLLLTTTTAPITEITKVLQAVRTFESAQVIGVHVEGPFISKAKAGAQREEFIIEPAIQAIDALLEFSDVIKIVTLAPEIRGALELIDRLGEKNIRASGGHSDANDEEARNAFESGMRQVTHTFNCMSSAHRRGIYRVAGLLEFALSEPEILCELIADGHHVMPTLMQMMYRAKGAEGICLVTDATPGAGLPNESSFSLGGRECIVCDGVCLLADGSALAGSASRMIDLVRTIVQEVNVTLHEAVAMATSNPARAVGIEKAKGSFAPGSDADLVIISPELEITETFSSGVRIFRNQGAATFKSRN
jgi:N-acetylglucosamine-6-phosphate deacetylase